MSRHLKIERKTSVTLFDIVMPLAVALIATGA